MHVRVAIAAASMLFVTVACGQSVRYRGAPDPIEVDAIVGADPRGHDRGVVIAAVLVPVIAAENGAVPSGIEPLPSALAGFNLSSAANVVVRAPQPGRRIADCRIVHIG